MMQKAKSKSRRGAKQKPLKIVAGTPTSMMPEWVQSMHMHYRENGFYRAEDLNRVLGDPGQCIEVKAGSTIILSHDPK